MVKHPPLFILLGLFVFLAPVSSLYGQGDAASPSSAPAPALSHWIEKIQTRRGTWTGLKADVTLRFKNAAGDSAACEGTLVYHRLEERILLQCYQKSETQTPYTVFALKTSDREFELYLPAHQTLYKGTIFGLADSPSINSHLRAWDLYRAFKPAAIPSENVTIKTLADGTTLLKVMKIKDEKEWRAREIAVSKDGDLPAEVYFGPTGTPSLKIERSQFEIFSETSSGTFPKKIRLTSKRNAADKNSFDKTTFEFKKIQLLSELSENDFEMNLPQNTHVMVLEEMLE